MQPARALFCVENFMDLPFLFETGHFPEQKMGMVSWEKSLY